MIWLFRMLTKITVIALCLIALSVLGTLLALRTPFDGCVKMGDAMPLFGRC